MWGFDRGTPVDRYYIERFLSAHRAVIRGRVLEVKDSAYTRRFGAGVVESEVLDIEPSNPSATIVADLSAADSVPGSRFDCFILTQTLQFIYDVRAALGHAHRLLAPGGVLLATVPVVSRLAPSNGLTGEFWRFPPAACRRLFEEVFGAGQITLQSYGNVTSAIAFLGWLYILVASGITYIVAGFALLLFGILAYLWRARLAREWPFTAVEGAG